MDVHHSLLSKTPKILNFKTNVASRVLDKGFVICSAQLQISSIVFSFILHSFIHSSATPHCLLPYTFHGFRCERRGCWPSIYLLASAHGTCWMWDPELGLEGLILPTTSLLLNLTHWATVLFTSDRHSWPRFLWAQGWIFCFDQQSVTCTWVSAN